MNDLEPRVLSLDTGTGVVSVDWPPPPRVLEVLLRVRELGCPPRPGEDPELDRGMLLLVAWLEDQERKYPSRLGR